MKKILKNSTVIVMIIMIIMGISSFGYSVSADEAPTLESMSKKIDSFKKAGAKSSIDTKEITTQFAGIGKILTTIGAGVLAIIITYMGIKYFMSSPEEQAKLKGQLIGVVVSGIVIFGAYSIWKMAVTMFKDM